MKRIKVLVIRFKNDIKPKEIPSFRGAINRILKRSKILFHNHLENGKLRYGYPLVQYKRIDGKAAIICMGEDLSEIKKRFEKPIKTRLGKRVVELELDKTTPEKTEENVEVQSESHYYQFKNWLALDKENYLIYHDVNTASEKIELLQKIIVGNIKSLCKGIGYWIPKAKPLLCEIVELHESSDFEYKGVRFLSFNCVFRSNIILPDNVGLGGKTSVGRGTLKSIDEKDVFCKRPDKLFLLGGKDLEMKTIKELIKKQRNCDFIDKNLRQDNAVLSKYNRILKHFQKSDIYAIELMEDMEIDDELKDRLHLIDHHNDFSHLPSSLEQVASILGVELNREQRLIAACDVGGIPAMKALMATEEEIAEIRKLEREAQGVTKKMRFGNKTVETIENNNNKFK